MTQDVGLGLRRNLAQFSLLVVVNAFVGAMVGLERTILPPIAERGVPPRREDRGAVVHRCVRRDQGSHELLARAGFRIASGASVVLVAGWLVAAPVPFLLMWAPSWGWVLARTRCSASVRGSRGRRRSS